MSQRIQVPLATTPIGVTKREDGRPGEPVFLTPEFRRLLETLTEGTGRSTTGFPDADLVGIPSYDMLAQIIDIQERLLTLEGRVNEREQDPRQELLDLASLAVPPSSGLRGPASSTDNAVVRWDGATGQLLQNSAFVVDDNGNITSFGGKFFFPAVQNPDVGANCLDDYEEGTFTPTFSAATAPSAVTYGAQSGHYTKIGNVVFFDLRVLLTSKGAGGAGAVRINDLPFTSSNSLPAGIVHISYDNITMTAGHTQLTAQVAANTTRITVNECGSAVAAASVTWANVANNSDFVISGFYHV